MLFLHGFAALTIAVMPALTGSESRSQLSTTSANSGDFCFNSAKQNAKFSSSDSQVPLSQVFTSRWHRFPKPGVAGSSPAGRSGDAELEGSHFPPFCRSFGPFAALLGLGCDCLPAPPRMGPRRWSCAKQDSKGAPYLAREIPTLRTGYMTYAPVRPRFFGRTGRWEHCEFLRSKAVRTAIKPKSHRTACAE